MNATDSSLQLSFDPTGDFVVIRVENGGAKPDFPGYVSQLRDYCDRNHCRRVLLDERELDWPLDTFMAYDLAEWMGTQHVGMLIQRIACVSSPARFEMNANMEVLAQNRGVNYRAFQTIESAEKWLRSGLPGNTDGLFAVP